MVCFFKLSEVVFLHLRAKKSLHLNNQYLSSAKKTLSEGQELFSDQETYFFQARKIEVGTKKTGGRNSFVKEAFLKEAFV